MSTNEIIQKIVRAILYAVAALMPLFFLPFTLEVLELNKHFLLYGAVLVATLLWLLDGAMKKKISIRRTPFDIPIAAYLGIVLIAGLFSTDRIMSFVGDYNNIQVGVIPLIFLVLYVFLVIQTCRTERGLMGLGAAFFASSGVAAIIFFLQRWSMFSLSKFGVTVQNTVSLSNAEFGLLLSLLVMIALSVLMMRKESWWVDVLVGLVGLISFADIVMLGFRSVYILLTIGLGILLVSVLTRIDYLRQGWITAQFALLVTSVLFIFLGSPKFTHLSSVPTEISLGVKESGAVAWNTVVSGAKRFLIGSGPSTFVYDFSKFKSIDMNLNPIAWRVRFGKPYASVISIISETGVLGTLGFLFLCLIVLGHLGTLWMKSATEKHKDGGVSHDTATSLLHLISPVWVTLFVALFFIELSVTLWFFFWLLIALAAACILFIRRDVEVFTISLKSSPQHMLATSFAVVVLFAGGVVFGVLGGRSYAAEVNYMHAIKSASSATSQEKLLSEATKLNSHNPRYYVALAQSFLNEAKEASGNANTTPDLISQLVASAVNAAKQATDIAPRNVATWETLASMYDTAQPFAPGINVWVTKSLETAVELEPNNPDLRLKLGNAKYAEGKKSEAKEQFNEAERIKPNYLDAYIALAQFYDADGDYDRALIELEKGKVYGGGQDPNFLFNYGRIHFNRNKGNDWDIARGSYELALQINPNHVNALFSAGVLADRQGRRDDAVKYYEQVIRLSPGNPNIGTVQQRLKQLKVVQENQ